MQIFLQFRCLPCADLLTILASTCADLLTILVSEFLNKVDILSDDLPKVYTFLLQGQHEVDTLSEGLHEVDYSLLDHSPLDRYP